jgi:signal transduction histidine kinase
VRIIFRGIKIELIITNLLTDTSKYSPNVGSILIKLEFNKSFLKISVPDKEISVQKS